MTPMQSAFNGESTLFGVDLVEDLVVEDVVGLDHPAAIKLAES